MAAYIIEEPRLVNRIKNNNGISPVKYKQTPLARVAPVPLTDTLMGKRNPGQGFLE